MHPSYVLFPGPATHPWPFAFAGSSFIALPPPRSRRQRRSPKGARARATVYRATLAADTYLEEVRAALRVSDDRAARAALAVARAALTVAAAKLGLAS